MPATIRRGSRGSDVLKLQQLLNQKSVPSPGLKVDGDFGARTEGAVRAYQTAQRLAVDGVVGPMTWSRLESGVPVPVMPAPTPGPSVPGGVGSEPAWMAAARREIGVKEMAGAAHHPRIIEYHATTSLKATTDETAWCASFVNWCLRQAGVVGSNSAAAASFINWGKTSTAIPGAICVIHNPAAANTALSVSGNHVGFLVEETATHYRLLGGNQSDSVKISGYPKGAWQLKGMRWPN